MQRGFVCLAAAAVLGLGGCATPPMAPAECAAADWRAIGYRDGAAGQGLDRYATRETDCATAGYPADFTAYRAGREEGLRTYCLPESAFRRGLDGASYAPVCPPELDGMFRLALEEGRRIHEVKSALSSAESALSSNRSERDRLERKIRGNEEGLINTQDPAEQQRIRDELRRLRQERDEAEDDIRDAERDMRYRNEELSRLRMSIGFRWGAW